MEGHDVNLWKRGFDYHTMLNTANRMVRWNRVIPTQNHTTSWNEIFQSLSGSQFNFKSRLCVRYAMQTVIHMIWCEKNKRLHGEAPRSA
ncbi:unnamed protein product, partial [Brassica napus]